MDDKWAYETQYNLMNYEAEEVSAGWSTRGEIEGTRKFSINAFFREVENSH